jgi:hypothetical protein
MQGQRFKTQRVNAKAQGKAKGAKSSSMLRLCVTSLEFFACPF